MSFFDNFSSISAREVCEADKEKQSAKEPHLRLKRFISPASSYFYNKLRHAGSFEFINLF